MGVYTFGDSHHWHGWEQIVGVRPRMEGEAPVLAYTIGREGRGRLDLGRYGVVSGDTVVFCYGEIDCRGHVKRHSGEGDDWRRVVEETVVSYVGGLGRIVDGYDGLRVCVYNVVPASRYIAGRAWPYVGSDVERRGYVRYFNECLGREVGLRGWEFIDVHDEYVDSEGLLDVSRSDGAMHIRDPEPLRRCLKRMGII